MKTVVEDVNLIRARSLNHRRFQNHLAALDDAEFGDVLFYNSVHWLSQGAFLERFAALLPNIVSFLKEIDHPVAHLEDDKFRVRLCVLTDIFGHLNKLNLLLQGRYKMLCNSYEAVNGFEDRVTLFKCHAEGGNFLHFKFTREFCGEDDERIADAKLVLADVLNSLETAFSGRFADFAAIDDVCKPLYCGASYLPNIVANVCSQRSSVAGQFHRFQGDARTKKMSLMLRKTISCFSGQRKCLCDFQC